MNCNEEIISGEKRVKMLHEYFDDYLREEMNKSRVVHEEGELYKVVTVFGKTFELWYGYYEDYERENPTVEPMPIYPNFRKEPLYTDEGTPFVTMMQDACPYYKGEKNCRLHLRRM